MHGLMMDRPLLISSLIDHAAANHSDREIISRTVEGDLHRYTYADLHARARRLASGLRSRGIGPGDRIGTIAWNGYRHLEAYFGVSSMGAICHTLNPRLHAEHVVYIVNHAGDRALLVDPTFVPLVEAVADKLPSVEFVAIMTDRAHMPETSLANAVCYEDLLGDEDFAWPALDERAASSLCYTSGTTGQPKGVLYSHRSTVLHSYAIAMPDALAVSERSVILPVVPMFHVNAWGIPYAAAMAGASLVMPGPALDGASLTALMNRERVTTIAGVPTVWFGLLNHLRETGETIPTVKLMIVGGAAPPRSLITAFREEYGIDFRHAWGMTETSPLGSVSLLKPGMEDRSPDDIYGVLTTQGRASFGVEMQIVDPDGNELPHDGEAQGELRVRGPWVASAYYGQEDGERFRDGWFSTGDVATIAPDGYLRLTDRLKDVIKSGGEWISSIDLENLAVGHPDVSQAAVIGVPHQKWDERPLLIVVPRQGAHPSKEDLLAFFEGKVATWWIPDDVQFTDALPIGATGKVLKTKLRQQFIESS